MEKAPHSAETITYSDFAKATKQPSRFIEGMEVRGRDIVSCPSCGETRDEIDHGQIVECGCGLFMARHGNALEIWK